MTLTKSTSYKDINRQWHFYDLNGKILGRVATEIAGILIGKSKSYFVPNLDCGDYVVVVNSSLVQLTGKKSSQKSYQNFSGYPGGLKKISFKRLIMENPQRIVKEAVSGMLPKNKLRDSMLRRLYIYRDDKHPYKNKFEHN